MTKLERLAGIISEYKTLEEGELTLDTTFEELELDSLDLVDLTMACEDEFDVEIEVDESIKTVGDLIKKLEG